MTGGWLERVAERAGTEVAKADAILAKRGVRPDRPLRPARHLRLTRIAFSGKKQGKATGPFTFDWPNLGPGIWAVASHGNLVGKSSVLEIVLWSLRGEPKGLQADVRNWLRRVTVEFRVDDQDYSIELSLEDRQFSGGLYRIMRDSTRRELDRFTSDAGFAAAISRFMMETLDLDPVPARQAGGDGGQTVLHGWTALSGALYFGGDHKLLLGDVQWGGLPARMLQMYVGMPWARTVMQATTAQKETIQEATDAARAVSEAKVRIDAARQRLERDLDDAQQSLAALPDEAGSAERLERLAGEVARLSQALPDLDSRLAQAEVDAAQLRAVADEDERSLRDLRENAIAVRFFNGLSPSCCPRCETAIGQERLRREAAILRCSLCSESITEERTEESLDQFEEAEQRRVASAAAVARAEAAVSPLRSERDRIAAQLVTAQRALRACRKTTEIIGQLGLG